MMNLDKKITLGDVASYLHMNPSYFSRLYKKDTNENFIDFVNRTKMERAKDLIESTNKSIEDIAYMIGFENKSYFLKIFKKYFGVVPNHYKGHPLSEGLGTVRRLVAFKNVYCQYLKIHFTFVFVNKIFENTVHHNA